MKWNTACLTAHAFLLNEPGLWSAVNQIPCNANTIISTSVLKDEINLEWRPGLSINTAEKKIIKSHENKMKKKQSFLLGLPA